MKWKRLTPCNRWRGALGKRKHAAQQEFEMNAVKFLIAAYIATWVIHGFYLVTLTARFGRAKKELKELGKVK